MENYSLQTLIGFIKERKPRVVFNDKHSNWSNISTAVPQGSIFGPITSLIFLNDLSINQSSNFKPFSSLFSVIHDIKQSGNKWNTEK